MHGKGVHDPGHDLGVGAHIRRRNVALRPDERADLGDIAAGHLFQLTLAELFGLDNHAALGAAVGQIHERALPGHPHGERAALVQRDVGVIAEAAFDGAFGGIVLDAKAGEHAHLAVVHLDREVHDQLTLAGAQIDVHILVQMHEVFDTFELPQGHGIGAGAGGELAGRRVYRQAGCFRPAGLVWWTGQGLR